MFADSMRKILASYLNHLVALAVRLRKSNTVCLISCRARKERDWCHHSARQIQCCGKSNVVILFLCSHIFSFQHLQYIQCKGWKLEMPCTQALYKAMAVRVWNQGYAALCTYILVLLCTCDWPVTVSFQTNKITVVFFSSLYVLHRCTSQRWRLIWPSTWTTKTSGAFPSTHHDSHSPSHTPRPSPSLWLCEKQKGKVTRSWARALERVQCSPIPCIVW